MPTRLKPGSLAARPGEPGATLLLVDAPGPDLFTAVRFPVGEAEPVPFQVARSELLPAGNDEAAARVLRMRWRTQAAARSFPRHTLRTALLLCAGLGTRLRPLTARYPKPALPFFDGPLVRYSFALLKSAGVERVVINTHHLPDEMRRVATAQAQALGLTLEVSHEPVIQGTGGALREARSLLGREPFLLLNGDSFLSLDLQTLVGAYVSRGDAATLAVVPMPPGESFPAVEARADLEVRRIANLGDPEEGLTPWHFVGAHVIGPEVLEHIAPTGESDINHDVYIAMIRAGLKVRACPVALGAWADLGTPRRYLLACEELLTGLCDLGPLGAHAPIGPDAIRRFRAGGPRQWVHPTAKAPTGLGGWHVVSAGARVESTDIRRCAVFPDTVVHAGERLQDAIAAGPVRLAGE